MAGVRFEGIYKLFGSQAAVEDLCLDIEDGEFLVLVGPSGCGKTTCLRMLAGLERPTYGRIFIGDRIVNAVPPKHRDIAMVFQNYALYPHMSVYENLAFGMQVRHEPREQIRPRVHEVAELLGIARLLDRKPAALSGGERQRVALGRALIRRPQVFLMDEPLSNLDAALRVQMRVEISRLHLRFRVTTAYVTHDQVEAMTMGDRIAVMSLGRLQQVDTPERLYDTPANLFVATFIGSPKMNVVNGRLTQQDGRPILHALNASIGLDGGLLPGSLGGEVKAGIRPEDLRWSVDAPPNCLARFKGEVDVVEPMGAEAFVTVKVADTVLVSRFPPRSGVRPGENIELAFDPHRLHLFRVENGEAIRGRSSPASNDR